MKQPYYEWLSFQWFVCLIKTMLSPHIWRIRWTYKFSNYKFSNLFLLSISFFYYFDPVFIVTPIHSSGYGEGFVSLLIIFYNSLKELFKCAAKSERSVVSFSPFLIATDNLNVNLFKRGKKRNVFHAVPFKTKMHVFEASLYDTQYQFFSDGSREGIDVYAEKYSRTIAALCTTQK